MRERGIARQDAVSFLLESRGATRLGRPDEIDALAACLASLRADFRQGAITDIDGGATRSL